MSFYIYDIIFLVIFSLAIGIFLYRKRKNLKREGILYLYRTQVGIKIINYIGGKFKKLISVFAFIGVLCGYLLMIGMLYLFYKLIFAYIFNPEIARAIKIPPLMPLIPYLPEAFNIDFLPPFYFTYWIIAIAIIAVFHEFAHGIVARRYNVKILTTGFGFLGPFLAAFVEPNEKEMVKKPKYQQIAILTAGVFTNLILAVIFFLLLSFVFVNAYIPSGAIFNEYTVNKIDINFIDMIGGIKVSDKSKEGILKVIESNSFTNNLILKNNGEILNLTKITANNRTYYTTIEKLKLQLDYLDKTSNKLFVYEDFPAINVGLRGIIVEVDGKKISEYENLVEIMKTYKPSEVINIKTIDKEVNKNEILEFKIKLVEDPYERGRAIIGIGYDPGKERILSQITDIFNFYKKPATYYEARFNPEFTLFVYNLIWWLAIINFSVALINMLPMGIFDGGRMFLLTVWGITGSEKIAQKSFKYATYVLLGALLLVMIGWGIAII